MRGILSLAGVSEMRDRSAVERGEFAREESVHSDDFVLRRNLKFVNALEIRTAQGGGDASEGVEDRKGDVRDSGRRRGGHLFVSERADPREVGVKFGAVQFGFADGAAVQSDEGVDLLAASERGEDAAGAGVPESDDGAASEREAPVPRGFGGGDDDDVAVIFHSEVAGLPCFAGDGAHFRQRGFHDAFYRRVSLSEGEHFEAERVSVAGGRAHHIAAPHEGGEHAIDFALRARERAGDFALRHSAGVLREEFEDVEAFFQRGRAIFVVGGVAVHCFAVWKLAKGVVERQAWFHGRISALYVNGAGVTALCFCLFRLGRGVGVLILTCGLH